MKKQISTYISNDSNKALNDYLLQHPEITKYKVSQQIIEKGVKELGATIKNKNGLSTGEIRPTTQTKGTAHNPGTHETNNNGELEE